MPKSNTYQKNFSQNPRRLYRYGFNGMEKDDEVKGTGNSYTTEFRQYDSRLGRWLSLDPMMAKYPWQSPYAAFNNNPIYYADPTGLEGEPEGSKGTVLDEVTVDGGKYERPKSKPAITDVNTILNSKPKEYYDQFATKKWEGWKFSYNSDKTNTQTNNQTNNCQNYNEELKFDFKTSQDIVSVLSIPIGAKDAGNFLNKNLDLYKKGQFFTQYKGQMFLWDLKFHKMPLLPLNVQKSAASATAALKSASTVKIVSNTLGAVSIIMTSSQIIAEGGPTIETGADLIAGGVAFIPVYGWGISTTYFLFKLAKDGYPRDRINEMNYVLDGMRGSFTFGNSQKTIKWNGPNPVSDSTKKNEIQLFDENVLDKMISLKIYSYYYSVDSVAGIDLPADLQYGFLAQEVKEVFPEIVEKLDDGTMYINFHEFIPLMIKAYKEQDQEIKLIKIEMELLNKKLDVLLQKSK